MKTISSLKRLFIIFVICALISGTAASAADLQDIAETVQTIKMKSGIPISENMEFVTYKNVAYCGEFSAYDPEGEPMTFQLVDKPARGAVTLAADGTSEFLYTPYENKTGKDSFTYIAIDASGNASEEATVKIKIEKADTKVYYADMLDHPAHNSAIKLAEEGIFVGSCMNGEYYFHPDLPVSRSEFLALAMSTLGLEKLDGVTTTGFYDDEAIAVWAKPYVSSALRSGVIQGTVTSTGAIIFGDEDSVSAADAALIVDNLLSVSDVPIETASINLEPVPVWACQAAVNLESVGILKADADGTLLLDHDLTRADAAQMLACALNVLQSRSD